MDAALAVISSAVSCFFLVRYIIEEFLPSYRSARMSVDVHCDSLLLRILLPTCSYLGEYISRLFDEESLLRTTRKIVSAGLKDVLNSSEFIAFEIILAVLFAILMSEFGWVYLPFGAVAGSLYAEIWIHMRASKRRKSITYDLPHVLDMLTLSVEAGLDFAQALSRIESKMKQCDMKQILTGLDKSLKMGMSRKNALNAAANESGLPQMMYIASLIAQADKFGTGIGPMLRASSKKLRFERFSRAERSGMKAAQMMILPTVIFIMPATFIIIFGPLFVRFMTGGFASLLSGF